MTLPCSLRVQSISDFSAATFDGRVRVVAAKVVGLIKAAPGERTRFCWARSIFWIAGKDHVSTLLREFVSQPQLSQLCNAGQTNHQLLSFLSLPRNITIAEEFPCFTLSRMRYHPRESWPVLYCVPNCLCSNGSIICLVPGCSRNLPSLTLTVEHFTGKCQSQSGTSCHFK